MRRNEASRGMPLASRWLALALRACLALAQGKNLPPYERTPCKPAQLFGPSYDPYKDFNMSKWDLDRKTNGWSSRLWPQLYRDIVLNGTQGIAHPLVIEVGVWKGLSSILMARALRERWEKLRGSSLAGTEAFGRGAVWSVDTFAGSMEFWLVQGKQGRGHAWKAGKVTDRDLRLLNGHPTIYWQFMANVLREGLKDYIVPVPMDGSTAAHWFASTCPLADVIHLDAGHEYDAVTSDIQRFWPLLRPGGILLGDDYSRNWPGVVHAANEFAQREGVVLHHSNPASNWAAAPEKLETGLFKWWVRKPILDTTPSVSKAARARPAPTGFKQFRGWWHRVW